MSLREEEHAVPGLLVVLLRSLRHWSQAELARASGIHKSQISLYERWQIVPTEANLKRLTAAVGVTRAEVLRVLPALRALVRLATRPSGRGPAFPEAGRISLLVGRAASDAFRGSVRPFLLKHLPALAGLGQPAPEPLPQGGADPAALGLLIVLLRSLRHWNQEELAVACGIHGSQVSAYELGKRAPRQRTLERIASAVGVPLGEALEVLPCLRGLGQGQSDMAEGLGRLAEDVFLLEVEPFVSEHLVDAPARAVE
jgi:transcriptional regulator with XRE-family HTH domain